MQLQIKNNQKKLLRFQLLSVILPLIGVYCSEYLLKLNPCWLCTLQRWCYWGGVFSTLMEMMLAGDGLNLAEIIDNNQINLWNKISIHLKARLKKYRVILYRYRIAHNLTLVFIMLGAIIAIYQLMIYGGFFPDSCAKVKNYQSIEEFLSSIQNIPTTAKPCGSSGVDAFFSAINLFYSALLLIILYITKKNLPLPKLDHDNSML